MKKQALLSRRATLGSLVATPLLCATTHLSETNSPDAHLMALGRNFEAAAARLDHAIADATDPQWELLEQLGQLEAEIVDTQAITMEGFSIKARPVYWALLGDLDPAGQSTTDKRMALSIVRDLIRLYDPGLERPRALKVLIKDIEDSANRPPAA